MTAHDTARAAIILNASYIPYERGYIQASYCWDIFLMYLNSRTQPFITRQDFENWFDECKNKY